MKTKTSSKNQVRSQDDRRARKALRRGKAKRKKEPDKYFVDEHGKRVKVRKGSFLDLAWDLVGSVHGPGDLLTNKDRWKDFGR